MKKLMLGLVALSFMFFVGTASASQIVGGISFSSTVGGFNFDGDSVTFIAPSQVTQASGDFTAHFAAGDLVEFFDFSYDPFDLPRLMWEGNGVTFHLNNITFAATDVDILAFKGTGIVGHMGYESAGTWNFSANTAAGTYSFSSSTAAVPEPGTLLLLGSGLAGLALYRRRSMNK